MIHQSSAARRWVESPVDSMMDTPPWSPASSAAAVWSTSSDTGRWPLSCIALMPAARLACHYLISSVTMALAPGLVRPICRNSEPSGQKSPCASYRSTRMSRHRYQQSHESRQLR